MSKVIDLTSKNFDEFIKSGLTAVDFSADWCIPCKILNPNFEKAAKEVNDVNFGKVDVDKETDLAQRFYVMSVPTIIFFKKKEQVDRVVGAISKEEIIKKIKENI